MHDSVNGDIKEILQMMLVKLKLNSEYLAVHLISFLFFSFYLFVVYKVFCLQACPQARRGHQISLTRLLGYHVIAEN